MKPLTCAATARRLEAYHDRELPITEQIAVGAHLEWCDACAGRFAELRVLRTALKTPRPARRGLSNEEAAVFTATVVNRLKAEQQASFVARVRGMFEDMHLVYAGVGATVATVVCVVIMLTMMRFATSERPDSLAAIVNVLATPLECESGNDFLDASGCRARWAGRTQRANEIAEQDAVFTLEAIITRQGRLTGLDTLRTSRHATSAQRKIVEALLDAVTRARLEGAQLMGEPSIPEMIWMVERATVRATPKPTPPLDLPLPPKKRAAGWLPVTIRA